MSIGCTWSHFKKNIYIALQKFQMYKIEFLRHVVGHWEGEGWLGERGNVI